MVTPVTPPNGLVINVTELNRVNLKIRDVNELLNSTFASSHRTSALKQQK